ncbi:hypothetical protein GYMLUDRAFT_53800 [Collybiopsis luxurians FD-317 M1]|nr:hypothetical protein GYMLUDRAFT_53800 [Collybiopsis luxurians FD-317 M1]
MSSQLSAHLDADGEPEIETQPQTQDADQQRALPKPFDEHLWAYLAPMAKEMRQIDLIKPAPMYRIGRNAAHNTIVFPGYKISNKHAEISWDGQTSDRSVITLKDLSSNGTYVNGVKVGRGNTRVLVDGAEIAFGSTTAVGNPLEDYRFIFRHTASGQPPEEGFYALYDTAYQLGRGSFASVVKCVERSTGLFWAAKMFNNPVQLGDNAGTLASRTDKMVSREIAILQRLSHPNICYLKDTFILEESKLILVLELVDGGDLLEYILTRSGLSEELTQHIAYQLCLALAYIHSLGIAHRDLKPENVLLTKDDPPKVKVADFGLAKAKDSQTMLKTMCGTPAYLAPEVVHQTNTEGYDHLVDSWSVGVIVFSMLTNASPFIEDDNQADIRMKIATRRIDWSLLRPKTENPMVIDFIESLLANDPASRLTLSGALDHPWLQDYAKNNGRDIVKDRKLGKVRDGSRETTPPADGEQSKGSAVFSRGFENLVISETNGAGPSNHTGPSSNVAAPDPHAAADDEAAMEDDTPPPSSQAGNLQAQSSRVLRRRRDVLDEMENGGTNLPQPSPELLSQFEEKHKRAAAAITFDQPEAGPSNPQKRPGKRALGDLSAVPEGEAVNAVGGGMPEDVMMNGTEGDDVEATPSKRPRQTPPVAVPATRGKKAKKPEPDPTTLRRSGRNANKSNGN